VVRGDWQRLQQVLTNLIDNAVTHGPQGRDVAVSYEVTSGEVITRVHDEGVPIPLKDRERIFDRFHQGSQEDGRAHRGMGLGLYISRGIVEAHGGRIWVEDGPRNSFAFSLPRFQE